MYFEWHFIGSATATSDIEDISDEDLDTPVRWLGVDGVWLLYHEAVRYFPNRLGTASY